MRPAGIHQPGRVGRGLCLGTQPLLARGSTAIPTQWGPLWAISRAYPTTQNATEQFFLNVATARIFLITLSHCDLDRTMHDKGSQEVLLPPCWSHSEHRDAHFLQCSLSAANSYAFALFYSFIIYNLPASKNDFQWLSKTDLHAQICLPKSK